MLHGRPQALRLDNGPQPGKPDQNAFIERLNRTYREEVLNAYVFESLAEVQRLADEWLTHYNEQRPHEALGRVPPTRFYPRPRSNGGSVAVSVLSASP